VTRRLWVMILLLSTWGGLVGARLWQLQVVDGDQYRQRALNQQLRTVDLEPPRGAIYDARGEELAVSMEVDSAFAVPSEVDDPQAVAKQIASHLEGIDVADLAADLAGDRGFVWVARQLDPPEAAVLRAAAVPGVHFLQEHKRYYPLRGLAAQILGFVGMDHVGLGGLEARYQNELAGEAAHRSVFLDALRRTAMVSDLDFEEPAPGQDLHLTLDASIQYLAERELKRAVEKAHALGGVAVVLDVKTGAVLAAANYPGFDPNAYADYPQSSRRNHVITDVYEPGSTFKMVPAAAALEANIYDPGDEIDCEMGAVVVDGVRIRDHKEFGLLTVREIIAKSSNVGAVKLGLAVGDEGLYEQMRALGFGRRTGIDLPGESPGLLPAVENWPPRSVAYMSFGQGVSVSALQLANAFAAVANGGVLLRPYLVTAIGRGDDLEMLHPEPEVIGRAMSAATARSVERLLEGVVAEGGTARRAAIPGYRVAGKTGTAQKVIPGQGYSFTRVIASFVGMAPARDPAIVCLVAVDEPQGLTHGGSVAAPAFAAIVEPTLHYLGIAPDRNMEGAETPWYEPPVELEEPVLQWAGNQLSPAAEPAVAALPARTAGIALATEQSDFAMTAAGAVAAEPEIPWLSVESGGTPDLVGLTARQAVGRAASLGLPIRLNGRGFVLRQTPAAGEPAADATLEVWLGVSQGP